MSIDLSYRRGSESPYRLLIVDDVEAERELLGARLERTWRFVVVGEAADGPAGVALAAELRPDVVTLDMAMPGVDGIGSLRRILVQSPGSKVVIVSGYVTPELVHATVDLVGASACLAKGIDPDRMVEEILAAVERPAAVPDPDDELSNPEAVIDREFAASARLAAIVESSDDAIIGKTLEGVVTSWNAGAERLYGYPAAEVVGRSIAVLMPDGSAEELSEILRRVAAGEPIRPFETRRVRKDQTLVDVSLAISPILDRHGMVVGASTIGRDVTARKLADAELARQAEDLARSNDELEQFAYVASHDLSEPLRTISGYVELLALRYSGQIDADADRFISRTVEGCGRMRQLIDDLLVYARAGGTEDLNGAADCGEVVGAVVAAMAGVVAETGGQVEYRDLPTVRGDSGQLAQLFQNLIGNGLKFARRGVRPVVSIEAHRQAGTWTFVVADNGIGIESQYAERVFGMFQRLHARDSYPGTGIGLAICMRIVRAHRGRIWIEDNTDGGARFCFTLPAVDHEQP